MFRGRERERRRERERKKVWAGKRERERKSGWIREREEREEREKTISREPLTFFEGKIWRHGKMERGKKKDRREICT